jgi:hypothetical protein
MDITGDDVLSMVLNSMAATVIANVSEKILALLKDFIMKDTYGSHPDDPNRFYAGGSKSPTYGFLDAFKWKPIENTIKSVTRELFYDYLGMNYFGSAFVHGSPDDDRREELADDLNVLGIDLNNDWGGKERKPFWNDAIFELFQEDQITKWFEDELFDLGFTRD